MNDQSLKITYPYTPAPENGTLKKVTEGIYWLRLPLPMALNHANVYCLEDDDGWTIIDTGINTQPHQARAGQIPGI